MNIPIKCREVDVTFGTLKTKKCPQCGSNKTNLGVNAILYFDDDSKSIDFVYVGESEKLFIYCNDCEIATDIAPNVALNHGA